ncbi:MAG TPA: DNA-processing protein DprA [Nostocaceae cyanobacterium]|nr:DNA-processing protein DprA [Nostocaceae cyanobacterium]
MRKIYEQSFIILALSLLKGIGAIFIKQSLTTVNNSYSYWSGNTTEQSLTQLLALLSKKYSKSEIQDAIAKSEGILSECELQNIGFTSILYKNYPQKLLTLKDPPPIIFYKGNFSLLEENIVTILGTRKPNKTGKIIAERIGKHFSSQKWVICNGLANGIDTDSIRYQDKYSFAKVVGVVGSGLAQSALRSIPKQSVENIEFILENDGLVISEIPPLKRQDTFSSVKSCRIQAGLGGGLILVQSSLKGGSWFTVKAAVELNIPLGVIYPVKTDIHSDDYGANRKIIEEGIKGLHEFVELNNIKYPPSSKVIILYSKESYPEFELALRKQEKIFAYSY